LGKTDNKQASSWDNLTINKPGFGKNCLKKLAKREGRMTLKQVSTWDKLTINKSGVRIN
jgi:hypothetical protein